MVDFRPFHRCDHCDGSCKALLEPSVVRELLRGQKFQLFRGSGSQLRRNALWGCKLAKLLEEMMLPDGVERDVVFFLRVPEETVAGNGPQDLRLLSLKKTHLRSPERRDHLYLQVVTGPGMEFRTASATCTTTNPYRSMLDGPAATFVPGMPADPDPAPANSLLIIFSWLASCTSGRKGHKTCPKWEHQTSALPTRVIAVTSATPKLHTPNASQVG